MARLNAATGTMAPAPEVALTPYSEAPRFRLGTARSMGATHRVRISVARGVSYPKKDDPRRERLEGLLKAAGRWADVSALDARALARKAGDPAWPAELRGAVKEFEDAAERFRITLSRLKETQT
jgi:hypothetical protein